MRFKPRMNSNLTVFAVIIFAACLTQFASDIYAPSLPAIAIDLNTHINLVQWSMAIYMLGVALSQLIYGPISDGVGRKSTLTVGMSIMLVGSFICMFAPHIHILIAGRFIQGCGAGAGAALWRSVFRDVFTGEQLAKYGSYLVVFVMFIVPAAPVLGGYLQDYFGWRSNFVLMNAYTAMALVLVIWGFKETSLHHHVERLQWSYVVNTFGRLLTSPIFMGITLCTFLTYGASFSWFVVGPVLLIHLLGIDPATFGWITFIGGGSVYGLAGWLNGRLVSRFGMANMMRAGWIIILVAGVLMLLGNFLVGMHIWAIVVPMIVFFFGSAFIWPNAFATAFTPFGEIAGYAGALYGFMQISGAAVIGGILSYLPNTSQAPLAIVILIASLLSWVAHEKIVVKHV